MSLIPEPHLCVILWGTGTLNLGIHSRTAFIQTGADVYTLRDGFSQLLAGH